MRKTKFNFCKLQANNRERFLDAVYKFIKSHIPTKMMIIVNEPLRKLVEDCNQFIRRLFLFFIATREKAITINHTIRSYRGRFLWVK